MKLTMNRKGTFQCHWNSIDGKCGVGPELSPKYTYHCVLEAADLLDNNGFIYDQLLLDKYFQERYSRYQKPLSCERIAINAVNEIRERIETHALKQMGMSVLYRVAVTIGVGENPPASLTCEWVPEKAKQVANVKRIKKNPAYRPSLPMSNPF